MPHQPFVEALRHYVATCPLAELAGQVGPGSGELRRLVPELAVRVPDLSPPLAGDPGGRALPPLRGVSALLCEAAQDRPVVLVLDDLHWADKPTLLLLRSTSFARPREASLLVLGTYREAELDARSPARRDARRLSRERASSVTQLGRLDRARRSRGS